MRYGPRTENLGDQCARSENISESFNMFIEKNGKKNKKNKGK